MDVGPDGGEAFSLLAMAGELFPFPAVVRAVTCRCCSRGKRHRGGVAEELWIGVVIKRVGDGRCVSLRRACLLFQSVFRICRVSMCHGVVLAAT